MFRKFSCGCIGLVVDNEVRILVACDERDQTSNGLDWSSRDMSGKTSEPLSAGETQQLEIRIRSCFGKADRLDQILQALLQD